MTKKTSCILVITNYHVILFSEGKDLTRKQPKDYHLYDIKQLINKQDFILAIIFQRGKTKTKLKLKTENLEVLLTVIRRLKQCQNSDHCSAELELMIKSTQALESSTPDVKELPATLDTFMDQYRGWCSYYESTPNVAMTAWITRMFAEGNREIDLHRDLQASEFSDTTFDMLPLFNALQHDRYFSALTVQDLKKEVLVKALAELVLHNSHLKKLSFRKCSSEAFHHVFLSLSLNKRSAVQLLDVSENAPVQQVNNIAGGLHGAVPTRTHTPKSSQLYDRTQAASAAI
ncbi:hypothetical protein SAMD00019534_098380 [Acytostelium subglobosum LB1]|uniref:hypothetical protein n=1 Tax=Acytostelium subglobosum LB1 TaxID=1410327 RepID=UPI000644D5C6|nr:hypothetical protein SAMD00019534_098380 [Acytostelium subglobosum LB1]GAM26663.1 hypothetical protein SAMD00019534_098380 [Acytostelium subglobosum LB1]|eukprot:XP_012750324.1 hypothetical protein SAMD00019534_098380 [Acytostelium subglobosum LB1]